MRHPLSFLFAFLLLADRSTAQEMRSPGEWQCATGEGPVRVRTLHSDSACTSFLICIDTVVPLHLHRSHTEHVFVLEGEGEMRLADRSRTIRAGDTIIIPKGTPHGVTVTSGTPLRIISVQSPLFDGSDRVPVVER